MRIRMMGLSVMGAMTLAACEPTVPDSGAGVGFGSYEEYQKKQAARDAQLTGQALPAAPGVQVQPIGPGTGAGTMPAAPLTAAAPQTDAERLAADTAAALNSGQQPLQASPSNPAPQVIDNNNPGISNENNFEAVGQVRTIEDDKAHLAQIRAQYEVVQPTALPSRSGASGPNIVEYALKTNNSLGQSQYRRVSIGAAGKFQRNCAKYPSPDLAQEDFLAKGGPERDRLGLDPDGDGFACSWDPAPFRKARG